MLSAGDRRASISAEMPQTNTVPSTISNSSPHFDSSSLLLGTPLRYLTPYKSLVAGSTVLSSVMCICALCVCVRVCVCVCVCVLLFVSQSCVCVVRVTSFCGPLCCCTTWLHTITCLQEQYILFGGQIFVVRQAYDLVLCFSVCRLNSPKDSCLCLRNLPIPRGRCVLSVWQPPSCALARFCFSTRTADPDCCFSDHSFCGHG